MYACIFCNTATAKTQKDIETHQENCIRRTVRCNSCGDYNVPNVSVKIDPNEFDAMRKQIAEMHALFKGLAEALPMVKAMMPPSMRAMLEA